jgi:farnesyl diphosphate synthase
MAAALPAGPSLEQRLMEAADLVTVALDELLPRGDGGEARLTEAMRYAALGPGRRLRPYFVLEAARLFAVEARSVLRAACALECLHAASLVHADLPALEEATTRRGRSAVHRQYDEAAAVLAGDALQAAAFEILSHPDTHEDAEVRSELIYKLSRAAGAKGLAGGRMIALQGDLGQSVRMQRMKVGALIAFAFEIPVVIARPGEAQRNALRGFAQDLGFAYQGLDGEPPAGGRRGARDRAARALAEDPAEAAAKAQRRALVAAQCKAHLDIFGERAHYLRECVDFVLDPLL